MICNTDPAFALERIAASGAMIFGDVGTVRIGQTVINGEEVIPIGLVLVVENGAARWESAL